MYDRSMMEKIYECIEWLIAKIYVILNFVCHFVQ
jgi:hypothetical protein